MSKQLEWIDLQLWKKGEMSRQKEKLLTSKQTSEVAEKASFILKCSQKCYLFWQETPVILQYRSHYLFSFPPPHFWFMMLQNAHISSEQDNIVHLQLENLKVWFEPVPSITWLSQIDIDRLCLCVCSYAKWSVCGRWPQKCIFLYSTRCWSLSCSAHILQFVCGDLRKHTERLCVCIQDTRPIDF